MHQRHNIRHNMHQAPMMRPPHIPSQMNVSIAPHPQQVNMQQPPPQLTTQQPPTQQAQPHTQHANIPLGTGAPIMSQYIPTTHQRGDPNRLGHHIPPPQQQQQQQQQQQPQPQSQQQPPSQLTLQQPTLSQPPQRISPQMHQPHYMKSRPPNINNNNIGGVNVSSLQQQHPQLQPPPPSATTSINNHPLPHQSHHQPIPPQHQQQQPQHQLQPMPMQQHNNNTYNPKQNHASKIVNHQTHKYNSNTGTVVGLSKVNQIKHSQQHLQSPSQSHHQQQPQLQQAHQTQIISNIIQPPQQAQPQSQMQTSSQQHNTQPQLINQCGSQAVTQIISQTQISQHIVVQNSNKVLNSSALINSATNSACSSVNTPQTCSNSSPILVNSTISTSTQPQSNQNIPIISLASKSKTSKNSSSNVSQNAEQTQSQKANKKQNSEATEKVELVENNASQTVLNEAVNVPSTENISSGKEKTPMCLVNELARHNQIQHQYRLTGEQGPAHSKRFTVILNLGDEEYTAEGLSIKKAQHTAAAEAITKTKYEHPPPKKVRHKNGSSRFGIGNITPTVELNALAMKLGERAVYVFDSPVTTQPSGNINQAQTILPINQSSSQTALPVNPNQPIIPNGANPPMPATALSNGPQPPPPSLPHMPNYYCESNYQYGQFNSRNNLVNIYLNGNGMRFPNITRRPYVRGGYMKFRNRMMTPLNGIHPSFNRDACKITLLVGKQKFTGAGPTVQAAKHDAASRALEVLKPIAEASEDVDDLNTTSGETEIKSPISLVYEIGLKRNLLVTFEVKSEVGPPHLKNFITICKVGDITTEGEGNGKKVSKKRAAKKMLEELKKLPPLSPEKPPPASTYQNNSNITKANKGNRAHKRNSGSGTSQQVEAQQAPKKRVKNVIKERADSENPEEMNPISRLIQIQQALKEREPVYTVVEEKGAPRRREFTIEVSANGQSASGSGSNKKIAKRNAAKNLLIVLGYEPNSNNKENHSNIVNTAESNSNKVKISENDLSRSANANNNNVKAAAQAQSGSSSRQIVPGLIHLPQNNETNNTKTVIVNKQSQQSSGEKDSSQKTTSNDDSPNTESTEKSNKTSERKSTDFGVRPKDQLLYLAQILDFEAKFTDYPKGNHGEFLTIIALFTDPPQLCHGAGENSDASQDNAALAALQMLSKLGLDNVKPKKTQSINNNTSSDEKKLDSTKEGENN